jgi:acetolactate synthase-1/2/3 large subunit
VDAPCTLTLMGLGALPASDPHFLGMVGMHGTYEANNAMHDCDVMIAVGSRFDDRVTGRLNAFSPNSKKIHIDIDPSSINKNVRVDVPIVADCGAALAALIEGWAAAAPKRSPAGRAKWWARIDEWRARDCLRYDRGRKDIIKPQYALERLYALTRDRMTSGGLGTMGYGLPAAVGVQVAHPEALVIDVAGEASILMNIQEMSTIAQYRLPVKAFILNNQYMGMVRQWQELLHGGRYSESYTAALPDFVKLAEAFGAHGRRVTDPAELDDAIRYMIETPGAVVLDVAVDELENCFPMIPSGAAHNEMLLGPEDKAQSPVSGEGMVLV